MLNRIEGHLPITPTDGVVYLHSYWNPAVGDNAAIATWRYNTPPPGWTEYRFEGYLLPPPGAPLLDCRDGATADHQDDPERNAQGNLVNDWAAPAGLLDGDALLVEADPASMIRIDYRGTQKSVFGYPWDEGELGPAYHVPQYALIGRVTSGAVFVDRLGWYEAGEWFPVVGTVATGTPSPSPCLVYESTGGGNPKLQLSFNDPDLGDNGGYAPVTVTQWW